MKKKHLDFLLKFHKPTSRHLYTLRNRRIKTSLDFKPFSKIYLWHNLNIMSKDLFVDKNPSLETSWRSIILLGRNVASYKFALAKSLLEIDSNNSEIELEKLAIPFAKNICEHLDKNEKQITSSSSKFLDACKRFNNSQINEDELKNITVRMGFNNVIDAFHIVSREETTRFVSDNRTNIKSIILTDDFYILTEKDMY